MSVQFDNSTLSRKRPIIDPDVRIDKADPMEIEEQEPAAASTSDRLVYAPPKDLNALLVAVGEKDALGVVRELVAVTVGATTFHAIEHGIDVTSTLKEWLDQKHVALKRELRTIVSAQLGLEKVLRQKESKTPFGPFTVKSASQFTVTGLEGNDLDAARKLLQTANDSYISSTLTAAEWAYTQSLKNLKLNLQKTMLSWLKQEVMTLVVNLSLSCPAQALKPIVESMLATLADFLSPESIAAELTDCFVYSQRLETQRATKKAMAKTLKQIVPEQVANPDGSQKKQEQMDTFVAALVQKTVSKELAKARAKDKPSGKPDKRSKQTATKAGPSKPTPTNVTRNNRGRSKSRSSSRDGKNESGRSRSKSSRGLRKPNQTSKTQSNSSKRGAAKPSKEQMTGKKG